MKRNMLMVATFLTPLIAMYLGMIAHKYFSCRCNTLANLKIAESDSGFLRRQNDSRLARDAHHVPKPVTVLWDGKDITSIPGIYDKYKEALTKFPTLESCVGHVLDDRQIGNLDWASLKDDNEADICLFRMFAHLKTASAVRTWLESMGFRLGDFYETNTHDRVSSQITENTRSFQAYWDIDLLGVPLSTGFRDCMWLDFISYRYAIYVEFSQKGKLLTVQSGYDTK